MPRSLATPPDPSDTHTRPVGPSAAGAAPERLLALTVLGHAQASRIGERVTLPGLPAGEHVTISRSAPGFSKPEGGAPRPLADPFLSRNPLVSLAWRDGHVSIRRERADTFVRIDGVDLAEARAFDTGALEQGVVLEIGGRCVFLLHQVEVSEGPKPPRFDLVGDSDAIQRLRRDIARVAATDVRVLLRGETGTGKELVARALHGASARAAGPYVAVNMGAIAPSLAESTLFGHIRGSFSGAVADHDGHILAAHGGTLFLDEIGDTDVVVQTKLLRALETNEVQRIGDRRPRKVDLRLLSATDADLETAVAEGRFREPLLHRIGELTLRIPPLRARRDDLGRLVVHFLRELLSADEQARLLEAQLAERPWLSAATIAQLARAPWTGNVRQLRNVVRQLVVLCRHELEIATNLAVEATLAGVSSGANGPGARRGPERGSPGEQEPRGEAAHAAPAERGKSKRPQDLSEEEILDALAKTGWRRAAAADQLNIARSSLYAIIAANPRLRWSRDLTREQLEQTFDRHGRDVALAAAELHLSEHGLKLRLQALGLLRHR